MSFLIPDADMLFIHIPKSAGNSIRRWFGPFYRISPQIPNDRTQGDNYHSTADDAQRHLGSLDAYRMFTVVRNPWRRMFSWYNHRRRVIRAALSVPGPDGHGNRNLTQDRVALMREYDVMRQGFNPWLDRYRDRPWDNTWFCPSTPQTQWLGDHKFYRIFKLDAEFNQSLQDMALELDLQTQGHPVGRKNRDPFDNDYTEAFDQHSIQLVQKMHRTDIERFDFKFHD